MILVVRFFASWAGAAEGDFGMGNGKAGGNFKKTSNVAFLGNGQVGNGSTGVAYKVAMIRYIRAKPRRIALHIDLLGETTLHKSLEAVVNSG